MEVAVFDEAITQEIADVIYKVECDYDREGSGPNSRFKDECRDHAQAREVVNYLRRQGLLK